MLKEIAIRDAKEVLVHGRTTADREPLRLLWTGSAIELTLRSSELWIEMAGPFREYENWIAIEINGEVLSRRMVNREREWVCIYRSKMDTKPTSVRIIKEVQAMNADEEHCLEIYALRLDGELLPMEPRRRKIEFIGDSINSGEGTVGAKEEEEWISLFFSHVNSYPYMTGRELDADIRVISQSGWGLYASWDNNPACALPAHYENICSVLPGEQFRSLGFADKNDFGAWQPDVICVNLGTNDDGSFHNAAYTDPESGVTYKQHMTKERYEDGVYVPDGDYAPEDLKKVQDAARDFLKKLRRCNSGAYILWCFGILGDGMEKAIRAGMEEYRRESGDTRVEYLPIPNTTDETVGSRMHPGPKAHRQAADVIAARIRELGL